MSFSDVVVVLPGISGSVLEKDGTEVWGTSGSAILRALASGADSIRSLTLQGPDDPNIDELGDGVTAPRLVPDLHIIPGLWKIDGYSGLMARLETELGCVPDQNLFPFPYDWRRDNRANARKLQRAAHDWLSAWRIRSGNAQARLVLVAHSMGGLVASYFLEALEGWRETRALITFGTPFRGSLNALGYLTNGYAKGIGPLRVDLTPVLGSFTSVYQLLPAFECVDTGDGVLKRVGEMTGLPGVDAARSAAALTFYREISDASEQNSTDPNYAGAYTTYPIVGIGQPTFQSATFAGGRVTLQQFITGKDNGGDGTVARVSATPLSMGNHPAATYVAEAHASLQNFDPALVNLIGILTGTEIDLSKFRFALQETLSVDVDDVYAADAVTIRATTSIEADVAARVAPAAGGPAMSLVLRPDGPGGHYAAATPLPPGAYRVAVSAQFPTGPVTVNDIFLVVDPDAARTGAVRGTSLRRPSSPQMAVPQTGGSGSAGGAGARPGAASMPGSGTPASGTPTITVRITLVQGGLTNVDTPVAIAPRYEGLALAGSTSAFDGLLDAWLTRAVDLGLVGAGLGQTFPIFVRDLYDRGGINAEWLLLVNMGEPGSFAQDALRFLISNIVVAVKSLGKDAVATPLIGTRRKELAVESAIRAFLLGVRDGFERLRAIAASVTMNQEVFERALACPLNLTIVDPSADLLNSAFEEFSRIQNSNPIPEMVLTVARGRNVKNDPESGSISKDVEPEVKMTLLRITQKPLPPDMKKGSEIFEFSALSERSVVSVRESEVNEYWLRLLPERLAKAHSPTDLEDLGRFFTNIIVPNDFRKLVETDDNLVFEVDKETAKLPWEMAAYRNYSDTSFVATRTGVSRQFRTLLSPSPSAAPPLNRKLKVLVIADPASGRLALPQAQNEGFGVAKILDEVRRAWQGEFDISVKARIGAFGDAGVMEKLEELKSGCTSVESANTCDPLELAMLILNEQFDLIHYAGHGFYDERSKQAGWVLASDCFLTAQEIFRVRQVPRLVFANACFSAKPLGQDAPTPEETRTNSVSLAQAFFARGIPNYIGTGWRVGDECALEFARWFYARVLGLESPDATERIGTSPPATIGEALRYAREQTVHCRSVSTWGAYQHYGRVSDKLLPFANARRPAQEEAAPAAEETAAEETATKKAAGPVAYDVNTLAPAAATRQPAAKAPVPDPKLVYVNGIDAETGRYAIGPQTIEDVARRVLLRPDTGGFADLHADQPRSFSVAFGVDPTKIEEAGWAVVFHERTPPQERQALEPLLARRREQAGSLYKELDFESGEQTRKWYERHNISAGNMDPAIVPYYLLLVGPPDRIPFEFQYLIGVEYSVGRLAFDTADEYARYANSVVAYEKGATVPNAKQIAYWGTEHAGDPATTLSASMLMAPLTNGVADAQGALKRPISVDTHFSQDARLGDAATKANLLDLLHAQKPPAFLFTASHGMAVRAGNPAQVGAQGALLCQDWTGLGSIRPEHFLAAADVDDDANVNGLVAFHFACYGAGTPNVDQFPLNLTQAGTMPAPAPKSFMAALPRRLLTHPNGSALAVIGHVDRAWGFSIQAPKIRTPQIATFRNSIGLIVTGSPIGYALSGNFGTRYSALSTALSSATAPTHVAQLSDAELVNLWLERNDAQNYVLLGDPAVRVRTQDLQAP
jgi:hypothetical protein